MQEHSDGKQHYKGKEEKHSSSSPAFGSRKWFEGNQTAMRYAGNIFCMLLSAVKSWKLLFFAAFYYLFYLFFLEI